MKKITLTSDNIRYSPALEMEYKRAIRELVNRMVKEVSKEIAEEYRDNKQAFAMDGAFNNIDDKIKALQKKYQDLFNKKGVEIAKKMVMKQLRYSRSILKAVLSKILPKDSEVPVLSGNAIPRDLDPILKASIMENVSLIKNIPEHYFEQITGSVARSMQAGGSIAQLKKELLKYKGMTERRADIIAYDQTRKTFQAINLRNMQKAGVRKAMWVHSGGGQTVREYHFRKWDGVSGIKDGRPNGLNGFIFNIDDPPVIQHAKGKQQEIRGYPAQLVNCKCVMRAVVDIEPV